MRLWYRRLAHLNYSSINQLSKEAGIGINVKPGDVRQCEVCVLGKLCKKPFTVNEKRASDILELVHTDLCYVTPKSNGNATYFLTFLDDYTGRVFVYFLKTKDQVYESFKHFKNYEENETGKKVFTGRQRNGVSKLQNETNFRNLRNPAATQHPRKPPVKRDG